MGVRGVEIYTAKSEMFNAFEVGAKGRYIFLTEKLIKNLDREELASIVVHELAHIKLSHVLKKILLFDIIIGLDLNFTQILSLYDSQKDTEIYAGLILFSGIIFYMLISRYICRYFEY